MTDEYTIEDKALDHYAHWWEARDPWSKYDTRWEKLIDSVSEDNTKAIAELIREAHVYAFVAGVSLRLTGE
jgi:hypothetical protein